MIAGPVLYPGKYELIRKRIWTVTSPPISGDLGNIKISTENTIANRQSWYTPNFIKPQKVIAQIRTTEFRAVLEGSSMSCTNALCHELDISNHTEMVIKTSSAQNQPYLSNLAKRGICA